MGPKYEFTGETRTFDGHVLHRIRRLSDEQLGGWLEKEENLSQEGHCWVDDEAMVYDDAKIYGNAKVSDGVIVSSNAQVYGDAKVSDNAWVSGNAKVYDNAIVYGGASVWGDAKIHGDVEVNYCVYNKNIGNTTESSNSTVSSSIVEDFIYKINDSNKLVVQTEYDSIEEFFSEPAGDDLKLDTLVICTVDTKEPIIKLQKIDVKDKTEFKFIVDVTNEEGDNFSYKSTIKSQEHLAQLVEQTVEALRIYPQLSKYADDLGNCL